MAKEGEANVVASVAIVVLVLAVVAGGYFFLTKEPDNHGGVKVTLSVVGKGT